MRRIRSKITYANVVATLALFIALGGVSYAAVKIPTNSVGEKQLKKNAVTAKKIKKSTITADKIKNGTLTGADINLSKLGKVPSASTAGTADFATGAANSNTTTSVTAVTKRVAPSITETTQDLARAGATEVPLFSNGQVSLYGQCYIYSGSVYAEISSKTTADGAFIYGANYTYYGSGPYLNTSTPEPQRSVMYASASNNSYGSYIGYSSTPYFTTMLGPDGNGLMAQMAVYAKQGTLTPNGNGAYGPGNVCIFQGTATKQTPG
jgi:hypothetical protein